jgi:demethylmenaquinone methyltransferase/2-methoxy-6-polyprenyl-1,4-benzoquinol methylase
MVRPDDRGGRPAGVAGVAGAAADDPGRRGPGTSPAGERTAAGVRAMFDRVAPRYDLANTVFSLGRDRAWRAAAARASRLAPGEVAVDVACGTGALTRALARYEPAAVVVGLDFSMSMVRRAPRGAPRGGPDGAGPRYLAGDATRLPFPDGSVDVVTIAFGLRNLPDPEQGLREFRRVLRAGGRVVVCECSTPTRPAVRQLYERYLTRLMPLAARRLTSDPEAYEYLARSVRAWPDQPSLARRLRRAGFTEVQWRDLTGGIVALHRGVVRARPEQDVQDMPV